MQQELRNIEFPRTPQLYGDGEIGLQALVADWLRQLEEILQTPEGPKEAEVSSLFYKDAWWRDQLGLQWDLRTIRGVKNVTAFLQEHQPKAGLGSFKVQEKGRYAPKNSSAFHTAWVLAMFSFETKQGLGFGVVRLLSELIPTDSPCRFENGPFKAHTISTSLQELKSSREPIGIRRPIGNLDTLPGGPSLGIWKERREREMKFQDEQPVVLVVGAGHSGLDIAARLKMLGLSCLIVERNERIGDNWRNRYKVLTTHDPAVTCHMPYLPFPKNWPRYTPKDKLADWFEAYASIMELNVWTSCSVVGADYDDKSETWSVRVEKKGADGAVTNVTIQPHHLVWATGHSGEPYVPTFPGQDKFAGTLYHAIKHTDAESYDVRGKKVVVVGTGNSGHDIAENYCTNGADVTMLQRGPTYVCTQEKGLLMMHEGVKDEDMPSVEEADIFTESMPIPMQFAMTRVLSKEIAKAEEDTLSGLRKAGFQLDDTPLWEKYLTTGGGYYIDIGCSQLIIDGRVKMCHSPNGIKEFTKDGLVLANGKSLPADIVVLATGYDNMRTTVRKVLGDKIADQLKDIWGLDHEGELNAVWRPSGHPRFWYMAGNLSLCRTYSRFLALQIKAIEEGLT